MVEIISFLYWIVIIESIMAGIIESIFFIITLVSMDKNDGLRRGLFYLFMCSIFTIIDITLVAYFVLTNLSFKNNLWSLVFIAIFFIGIFFILSTRILMKSINTLQNKKTELENTK